METMGLPIRKSEHHYTYRDCRQWPDDERWELISGVAYNMSPAPTTQHQGISRDIGYQINAFLKGRPCQLFMAPVDVFFPRVREQEADDVDTVVQPDLVVVCDPAKILLKGIWGPPDLTVEILSPSTSRKDLGEKYELYQRAGVREYWVVDPVGRWIGQFVLAADGRYADQVLFEETGTLVCTALPGLEVDVGGLWGGV